MSIQTIAKQLSKKLIRLICMLAVIMRDMTVNINSWLFSGYFNTSGNLLCRIYPSVDINTTMPSGIKLSTVSYLVLVGVVKIPNN